MSLRTLEWGKYPAQQADFHMAMLDGRSIIIDGAGTNNAGGSALDSVNYQLSGDCPGTGSGSYKFPSQIVMATLRSILGHSPVIVKATLNFYVFSGNMTPYPPFLQAFYRLLTVPDWADADSRYYDKSAVLPWGGDAALYGPVPDLDYLYTTPFALMTVPSVDFTTYKQWLSVDITSELRYVLAANKDLLFLTHRNILKTTPATLGAVLFYFKTAAFYPYISIQYAMPVEFFKAKADNSIDLTQMLNNALDIATGNLDLGAVERGQTGTPVPAFTKNLGTRLLPHLEVWDDSPEWAPPSADPGNTGSKALAYVTLAENAVSQKWFIHFTSATAFEVKSEGYLDNASAVHPSYGGSGWDGVVGSDWTAPSGGLTIPAAAWSGTAIAGDLFYIYVTGQTTDAAWPADSNQQVDMMHDDGGVPDLTTLRPIKGQRTQVAAGVTIDSTVKTITVLHIDPTKWQVNTKCFIANAATIDEGYVSAAGAFSVQITFPSVTNNVYVVGDKVCTTLPFRSLAIAVWGASTGAAGDSQTNPALIPLVGAATKGFTTSATIAIMSISDPSVYEEATIYAVDDIKITCAAFLTHDYEAGAWVVQAGGEQRFWERINALPATTEELKRGRMNVRT